MARAKSPEKRQAILQAAVREIADAGLGASTARIAKAADLAEGTMFRYFSSKDDLLNELYIELKSDIYRRIQARFPRQSGLRERTRHIWNEYLRWAIEKPDDRKVSVLLHLSTVVSVATREGLDAERSMVTETMDELGKCGAFKDLPAGFASSAMAAMQEAVLEIAARRSRQKRMLVDRAFEAFWKMTT